MKQILLYRAGAKLTNADLSSLRESGFIPIKVAKFDDVKVIDAFAETATQRGTVFAAAMEAIAKADGSLGARTRFGQLLSERLANITVPK